MDAKDIMIGDYLRVAKDNLCIKKDTIVEIRGVDADDKIAERGLIGSTHCRPLDHDQFEGGIWCEYLEPIPLTAEILKKNFDKRPECYGIFDDYFDFMVREYSDGIFIANYHHCEMSLPDTQIVDIAFVHELQHALKLCRIEKEIQL